LLATAKKVGPVFTLEFALFPLDSSRSEREAIAKRQRESMSRQVNRRPAKHTSSDGHVFVDDSGRLWSAVQTASIVVFTCISDARQARRALAIEDTMREDETGDETLRAWLGAAPKIGSLS
jgi:hypothetical protein